MTKNPAFEQVELVLRKLIWAQEIIAVAQEGADKHIADILSGVNFIINSAEEDAQKIYRSLD